MNQEKHTMSSIERRRPSRWSLWIDRPLRFRVRKVAFQIHLWVGLLAGALVAVIGLSGSAIVFRDSLSAKSTPELYRKSESVHPVHFDEMFASVKTRFPSRTILAAGPTVNGIWSFRLRGERRSEYRTFVYVDPSTNRLLGTQEENQGIVNFLVMLHIELLGGNIGILIEGIAGLLLFLLSISGIILWWPGRKRWKGALKIRLRARWPKLNWDLHTTG